MFYKLRTFVVFFKNLVELEFLETIWRRNNGTNVVEHSIREIAEARWLDWMQMS